MTTMNISLPDEMKTFVEEQVQQCGYSTASEYLRDLIRDAQRQAAKERLEKLLLEGLDSGPATPLTRKDWEDLHGELEKRRTERHKR